MWLMCLNVLEMAFVCYSTPLLQIVHKGGLVAVVVVYIYVCVWRSNNSGCSMRGAGNSFYLTTPAAARALLASLRFFSSLLNCTLPRLRSCASLYCDSSEQEHEQPDVCLATASKCNRDRENQKERRSELL